MKGGKFDDHILKKLIFDNIKHKRKEVIIGSGTGIDSSIIDLGEDLVVVTMDPITASVCNIGSLCVNICCNDIAAAGGEPVAIFITMLMPYDFNVDVIKKTLCDIDTECEKLNIQLSGGHTEKTDAVTRLVLCATVIGRKKKSLDMKRVNLGDVILMTKTAGLEGSSIIAYDYENRVKKYLNEKQIKFLKGLISQISILPESRIAAKHEAKHMHDVTEGGVLGAAWEMAQTVGRNVEIYCDEIFIYDEIKTLCEKFNINPLKLISSGSLLIAATEKDAEKIKAEIENLGIQVKKIGKFIENKSVYIKQNRKYKLTEPKEDEIYKI